MGDELDKTKHGPDREAREKRSATHGIEVREDGHDTPPKGFPTNASAYADPVNYMYPLHDDAHIRNALARFAQHHGKYSTKAQKKIYAKIVRAALRNDIEVMPSKALMTLLPESVQGKFNKSEASPISLSPTAPVIVTTSIPWLPGPQFVNSGVTTGTSVSNTPIGYTVVDAKNNDSFFEEELVEKTKHQAMPSTQKLASLTKESEDGVLLVEGRCKGSTERRVCLVLFDDARFDEDARDTYVEKYFYAPSPDITSGHGVTHVELHDPSLFADESFDVTDPAIQGLPFCRSTSMPSDKTELEVIAKSAPISFYVPFSKSVAVVPGKDMVIRSVIYPADRTDFHNEYATASDLEKAAHGWMMHSQQLNVEHTPEAADGILPAESYIAKTYEPEIDAYPGDWCGVFYAKSESTKKAISDRTFKGFSIEGGCVKVQEGLRKRMTNILVSKISLVKDPATMIEWVAKGKNMLAPVAERVETEGNEAMETLKKQLDGLQEQTEKLGGAVGSETPKLFPSFKSVATETEQKLNLMHDQVAYIGKFVENSLAKVIGLLELGKSQAKEAADAKEALTKEVTTAKEALAKAQAELADVTRMTEVLNEIPQVQSFREKLLAEIAGESQ